VQREGGEQGSVVTPGVIWAAGERGESESVRAEITAALRTLLVARGVSTEEIDAALAEDRIDLLVIDRLLLPPSTQRTGQEVIETVGMPAEQADRLWRALGFAEAQDSGSFSDADVEALRTIHGLVELGLSSTETSVQVTRVLGSSMARLSDALISAADATAELDGTPPWVETSEDDGLRLAEALAFSAELVLPSMEKLIVYAWRRHIQAAARRRVSLRRAGAVHSPMLTELTVGFADMVGFTALSSQLNAMALARVVDRFEELAHSIVVEGGGRAVKMIGDEVMFVTADPFAAVGIALNLVDAYADDDLLSDVRVGIATGPVLMREGDFFGVVVNRASRIVNIADAGTVLVSEEARDAIVPLLRGRSEGGATSDDIADDAVLLEAGLVMEPLKPRELKDIGRVTLWSVNRAGRLQVSEERRSGARWRRMSSIGAELEALRALGERAIESIVGTRAGPSLAAASGPEADEPEADDPEADDTEADDTESTTPQAARILPQG
jgi:adenylate cyclase